jgi:3-mercaptopyruvate sulfurtransferase SseA
MLIEIIKDTLKLIITFSLILMGCVSAAQALERFEIVTTQELRQILAQRAKGMQDFVLVNSLDALIYNNHFIPGSVNIPWHRVTQKANHLGTDRNRLIITYCMGYR